MNLKYDAYQEFNLICELAINNISEFFIRYKLGEKQKAYDDLNFYLPKFIDILKRKSKLRSIKHEYLDKEEKINGFYRLFKNYGQETHSNNYDKLTIYAEDNFGLDLQSRVRLDENPYEDYPD